MKKIILFAITLVLLSCDSDSDSNLETPVLPTNIVIDDITGLSGEISWASTQNSTLTYEIEYGISGFEIGTGETVTSNNQTAKISGLQGLTTYDLYLRSSNGAQYSAWSEVYTFTTSCDNGTFTGNVFLSTQQEVDDFGANCYTGINGDLNLYLSSSTSTTISSLTSLQDLITITGALTIHNNDLLTSLDGLDNITSVDILYIRGNSQIENLDDLEDLTSVTRQIYIHGNPSLNSISALSNLTNSTINDIFIAHTTLLQSLHGLESITTIDNSLRIGNNAALTSLDGLENLISANSGSALGGIEIGVWYSSQSPYPNPNLTDFCALTNLFTSGGYNQVNIDNNAYNPTIEDILEGNCSN